MQGPEGAGKFSSDFSAIAIRWLWLGMIGLFVSLSVPKLLRATAKTSVHFVGPFHSTDTFLHFDTGEINASEHLVAVLGASFVIFCAGFGALRLIGAPADRGHPEFGFVY